MNKSRNETEKSLKLIAKSSAIVFAGVIFSKIVSYLYRIVIAREFGPEVYGLFSLAVMLSGWFIILAIFGLNEGLLRYISRLRGKNKLHDIRYIFRKSLFVLMITGPLMGLLFFLSAPYFANEVFNEPGLEIFLQLFALIVIFGTLVTAFLSPLRAYEKISWYSFITNILANFLHIASLVILLAVGVGVVSVPLSYLISSLIVFVVSIFVLKKQVPSIFEKPELKKKETAFNEVFAYSWPLLFAGIVWRVFNWTDTFLIGFFETSREVGFYNAAVPIAMLLSMVPQLFMQLFYPLINKEYSRGQKETVKQLSQQVGKWAFVINLPLFLLLAIFPEIFLSVLFGAEYVEAAESLRYLSFGVFFMSLLGISNRLITMIGKSKVIFYDIIVVASFNIILNIIMIPKYGIVGAAISTAISFALISVISAVQAFNYLGIFPARRKVLNSLLAGLISLGALLYFKDLVPIGFVSLAVLSVFFFAFYFVLTFVFKGFDRNDISVLKSFIRKIKR